MRHRSQQYEHKQEIVRTKALGRSQVISAKRRSKPLVKQPLHVVSLVATVGGNRRLRTEGTGRRKRSVDHAKRRTRSRATGSLPLLQASPKLQGALTLQKRRSVTQCESTRSTSMRSERTPAAMSCGANARTLSRWTGGRAVRRGMGAWRSTPPFPRSTPAHHNPSAGTEFNLTGRNTPAGGANEAA